MKRSRTLTLAAGLVLGLAWAGSAAGQTGVEGRVQSEVDESKQDARSAEDAAAGAPEVAETYQRTINRGWEKAVAGETPAYACAGLKGRVMGTGASADGAAVEALFACNVLLPVRYFETLLEQIDRGEKTCTDLMVAMSTQLSAVTISVDAIQGIADALEADPESGTGALAAAIGEAGLQKGLSDPKALIKERLAEPVRERCPEMAGVILR
jgi:hypothetical protein